MNLPSLEKYYNETTKGGYVVYDNSLTTKEDLRDDIVTVGIPATKLASDNGIPTLANMIIVGKVLKEIGEYDEDAILTTLKKIIPPIMISRSWKKSSAKGLCPLESRQRDLSLWNPVIWAR